jgi:hypothetical protein
MPLTIVIILLKRPDLRYNIGSGIKSIKQRV